MGSIINTVKMTDTPATVTKSAIVVKTTPTGTKFDHKAFWARADKYLMNTGVPMMPNIIDHAQGTLMWDVDGKEYMDFTSGQMSALLGHSHPEIVAVVSEYAGKCDHLMSLMLAEPVVKFAEDLGKVLPHPLSKSFLLSTGSESVEAAIKIAKCATGRFEVVAFSLSYHGVTQGVASATYAMGRKIGAPVIPGQLAFPAPNPYRSPFRTADGGYDWEAEMRWGWDLIDRQSVGSLAAFVVEPILSAGGMYEPPLGYLAKLREECTRRGMLFIADEAQTGLTRTGDFFAFQRDGIVPDILALSKTIGCGLPVASVSTTPEIEKRALEGGYLWVTTHQNDPLPAAIASKVIEIALRDNLADAARARGEQIRTSLEALQKKYWCIGDIRGRGLLIGFEIIVNRETKAPGAELGEALFRRALDYGLSCQVVAIPNACGVFRLAPPVNVTEADVARAMNILERSFEDVFTQEPYKSMLVNGHL